MGNIADYLVQCSTAGNLWSSSHDDRCEIVFHEQWIFHTDKVRPTYDIIYKDLYLEGNQKTRLDFNSIFISLFAHTHIKHHT